MAKVIDKESDSCGDQSLAAVAKDYQTLFWLPMICETGNKIEEHLEEMLELIADFYEKEDKAAPAARRSLIKSGKETLKRRVQILGDMTEHSEVAPTRVDVVLKSENTEYAILSVLKGHFLFSQLHDYELKDVIDSMQDQYVSEGDVIIREGDPGDLFYILEEGNTVVIKFLCPFDQIG